MASFKNSSGRPVFIKPEDRGERLSIEVPNGATYYGSEDHGYGIDGVWIDGRWYKVPDGTDVVLTETKIECFGGLFGSVMGGIVDWFKESKGSYGFQDRNPDGRTSPEDEINIKRKALPEELTPPQEPELPEPIE